MKTGEETGCIYNLQVTVVIFVLSNNLVINGLSIICPKLTKGQQCVKDNLAKTTILPKPNHK